MPTIAGMLILNGSMRLARVEHSDWDFIWVTFAVVFVSALSEELAFRAYPLRKLRESFVFWNTQLIIAVVFGLYHQITGLDLDTFVSTFLWGLVYGLSAVIGKGIALPTGIHTAVNIGQSVFGGSAAIWSNESVSSATARWEEDLRFEGAVLKYLIVCLVIFFLVTAVRKQEAAKRTVK